MPIERFHRHALPLLLLLTVWPAFADTADVEGAKVLVFDVSAFLNNAYQTIAGVFKESIVSPESGRNVILALYTLGLVLGGLKILGGMDLIEGAIEWTKFTMVAAFALAAVTPQGWFTGLVGGDGGTLGAVLGGYFKNLVNTGGEASSAMGGVVLQIMTSIDRVLNVPLVPPEVADMDWMDKISFYASNILTMGVAIGFQLLAAVALALVGALVVGELFFAGLMIDLAVAMAPLLVPWLLFPPLSFLFDAWLRSILIGGMTFVVAGLLAKGVGAFSEQIANALPAATQSAGAYSMASVIPAFGGVFLLGLVLVFIAMKVSGFAAALIQGSGVSGVGIAGFKQAVGGMASMSTRPAGGAAAGTAAAARGVMGAANRALAGRAAASAADGAAARGKPGGGSYSKGDLRAIKSAARGAYRQARAGGANHQQARSSAFAAAKANAATR